MTESAYPFEFVGVDADKADEYQIDTLIGQAGSTNTKVSSV